MGLQPFPWGLAVSQLPRTFSLCSCWERDAIPGHRDALLSWGTSEGALWHVGRAGRLRSHLLPPGPPSLGPLAVSCSLLPSGAAIDLQRSSSISAWLCKAFWFLCSPPLVDTFVQVEWQKPSVLLLLPLVKLGASPGVSPLRPVVLRKAPELVRCLAPEVSHRA